LFQAYDFAAKINNQFSAVQSVTREEIGIALKLNSSYIARDVAACVQFGFLDKKDGKYQLTKLFTDIFMPENEKEKKLNFITAFGKPKLYSDLIAKFDGNVVPPEITNTLIKHHSISDSAAQDAANTFIESGVQVGVINENRILRYHATLSTLSKTQYAEIVEETKNGENDASKNTNTTIIKAEPLNYANSSDRKIPIHLTKDKMAYLSYPADINDKDIKLLNHAISGILLKLELEKVLGVK
jgi:hypothetical protein